MTEEGTAPKVELVHVEQLIALECYTTGDQIGTDVIGPAYIEGVEAELERLTLCVLVLKNGFTVTGEAVCVSRANFNSEVGRKFAKEDAIRKAQMLEGYLLKERLHRDAINCSSGGGDFGDS